MNEFETNIYERGSFRDPSGSVFWHEGVLYRQINQCASNDYDHLIQSGLYEELVKKRYLIAHQDVNIPPQNYENYYRIIRPDSVPFISYPYEWSFSQLKDAALLTLEIQNIAIKYGMFLKDANAFNIQFVNNRPIFIDTLSFTRYKEGTPWAAYRQFCQHFLGPLLLMQYVDVRLNNLFRIFIDGPPLDLISTMLPYRTRICFRTYLHIHLHGKSQKRYANTGVHIQSHVSKSGLIGLVQSLKDAIISCRWKPGGTEWIDYYTDTNYSRDGFLHKKEIVKDYIHLAAPKDIWDIGSNTGVFSCIGSETGASVIAFDSDPGCIEQQYLNFQKKRELQPLPLLMDITNPSPGIGWALTERQSLIERGPVDCIMALALIHHIAIGNNVPFPQMAEFFSGLGKWLIIEFIPKEDSQVQRLLLNREDIFDDYSIENFEKWFSKYFSIERREQIFESTRVIYIMRRRNNDEKGIGV